MKIFLFFFSRLGVRATAWDTGPCGLCFSPPIHPSSRLAASLVCERGTTDSEAIPVVWTNPKPYPPLPSYRLPSPSSFTALAQSTAILVATRAPTRRLNPSARALLTGH